MSKNKTVRLTNQPRYITPYNAQHIGRREEQQDYFAYSDIFNDREYDLMGAVSVLADGMGGLDNGRLARRTAVEVFLSAYRESAANMTDINERLIYAARAANSAVLGIDGAGTTICAAIVKDWKLYWLSVGDSRLYLYRDGILRRINKEHNYENVLNRMVQNGEILPEEALSDPNRAALTSYIGIEELEEIDFNPDIFPLMPGDSIMLCSDGLYRALSDEEMSKIIRDADDDVCDVLVKKAIGKNIPTQDNITVVLMDID